MTAEIPVPPGVERCVIETCRGAVPALRARPGFPNGRASIMVCGFMGTKEDFREILPLLSGAGYDAWAYDHLGQHGGEFAAAPDDGPDKYTVPSLAGQLREVTEAVSPGKPAHVVGHCIGGFIARSAALTAPGLVRTVTFLCCGPGVRSQQAHALVTGMEDLLRRGGPMVLWPLLKRALPKDDSGTRDFWYAKLATVNPHYIIGISRSLADETDQSAAVAAAGIRSMVMHGSREKRLWRPSQYADMARDLRADLIVIDQASHHVNMQQPEAMARNLISFWDRAEVDAAGTAVRADAESGAAGS
jgi:pimeloyl-ACP methyl ester carboxylesterase